MTMDDQGRAAQCRELVDDSETVNVARRGLMRYQHVKALLRESIDVVGKDGIAVPKRQAASP
jgi:hypothetical protein